MPSGALESTESSRPQMEWICCEAPSLLALHFAGSLTSSVDWSARYSFTFLPSFLETLDQLLRSTSQATASAVSSEWVAPGSTWVEVVCAAWCVRPAHGRSGTSCSAIASWTWSSEVACTFLWVRYKFFLPRCTMVPCTSGKYIPSGQRCGFCNNYCQRMAWALWTPVSSGVCNHYRLFSWTQWVTFWCPVSFARCTTCKWTKSLNWGRCAWTGWCSSSRTARTKPDPSDARCSDRRALARLSSVFLVLNFDR